MRKRQSHWLVFIYYRPCFDFSESVRVNAHNLINIHESSSSLILSAFYTVLNSRIRIIIIVLSVLLLVFPNYFNRNTETPKKNHQVLNSVKMSMHRWLLSFNSNY